jgi:hypothetical protein
MMPEIILFIAAMIIIYFFKDIITILSILSVMIIVYMYFTGRSLM